MHNIKEIRNDIETFKKALDKRFLDIDVEEILSFDFDISFFSFSSISLS